MSGIGDRAAARPDPGVVGDDPPVKPNSHSIQIGGDVDDPSDGGINGIPPIRRVHNLPKSYT